MSEGEEQYQNQEWDFLLETSLYKSESHWKTSKMWSVIFYFFNISLIMLASVITIEGIGEFLDQRSILIIGAVLAGMTSIQTFLNPGGNYTDHRKTHHLFKTLYFQARQCDTMEWFKELQADYLKLDNQAPAVPFWFAKQNSDDIKINPQLQADFDKHYNQFMTKSV